MTGGGTGKTDPPHVRTIVTPSARPILARHARLRFDETRKVWVLLAPERLLTPSETAVAVLKLCDGVRSVAEIAKLLSTEFDAPEAVILDDIVPLLQDLADRRFLSAQAPSRSG